MGANAAWLARVQHDLVKRLLWPARDRLDLGGPVQPGELRVALLDDDGNDVSANQLWQTLRALAPGGITAPTLDAFATAIDEAAAAAAADDVVGVLALQPAFATLARIVKASEVS